jgi:hypothetical protein
MAVIRKDDDRHLQRMIAHVIRWHEMLDRLVELKQQVSLSDSDVLTAQKRDWKRLAETARRHATEHTDPDTKQALLELAESYDKLAQRDANRATY